MDKEMKVLDNLIFKIGANSSFRENAPIFGCDNFATSDCSLEGGQGLDVLQRLFGGTRNLERLLAHATAASKYDFLFCLHETPSRAYRNFTDKIWEDK